jgi:hypothetical protein
MMWKGRLIRQRGIAAARFQLDGKDSGLRNDHRTVLSPSDNYQHASADRNRSIADGLSAMLREAQIRDEG